jgi:hypothetical protein
VSDVITLPAGSAAYGETISDTPIFNALAATIPPFCSSVVSHTRRSSAHRAPASFSRSCVLPRNSTDGGGRHRRALTLTEPATSTGRHHLLTPTYI